MHCCLLLHLKQDSSGSLEFAIRERWRTSQPSWRRGERSSRKRRTMMRATTWQTMLQQAAQEQKAQQQQQLTKIERGELANLQPNGTKLLLQRRRKWRLKQGRRPKKQLQPKRGRRKLLMHRRERSRRQQLKNLRRKRLLSEKKPNKRKLRSRRRRHNLCLPHSVRPRQLTRIICLGWQRPE